MPVSEEIWPTRQPVLETERLQLRPLEAEDAAIIQALAGNWAIADTTLNVPHPYNDGLAEQWIQTHLPNYEKRHAVTYGIVLRGAALLVGVAGLGIHPRFRRGELGYWIGQPHWKQGYATEAVVQIVDFGFKRLGLHKIHAEHLERNPASGAVLLKAGFVREGLLRDHVTKWDRFEDVVVYGLIAKQ
jgi:ribosomal-protein-alanine N-acetyltransferase